MTLEFNSRVVFVDDDPDAAELAARSVERESSFLSCEAVSDISEVKDNINEFACIVSDYRMPGTNGIELLRQVRDDRPNLPFILFTSTGSEQIASEAITAGVTDYIRKGRDQNGFERLAESIENAVLNSRTELETSGHQLRGMFQRASEAVFLKDKDGVYQLMNSTGAEMLDKEPRDIVGKTAHDFFNKKDAWDIEAADRTVIETGEGLTTEDSRIVNGEKRYYMNTKIPHGDSKGNIDGVIGIARDITERKKKERRLEAIFNNTEELLGFIASDGTILRVNDTAIDHLGFEREKVEGLDFRSTNYFFSDESYHKYFQRALEGKAATNTVEVEDDGEQRVLDISLIPIEDDSGEVSLVLVEIDDVTETRRNQRQLESIFNSSHGMIGLLDPEGKVLRINKAVEEFFNVKEEEVKGESYDKIGKFITGRTFTDFYNQVIQHQSFPVGQISQLYRDEVKIEKEDGQTAILDISMKPVRNENGDITAILIEGREITDIKINERQLEDQRQRLEKFSSIVSHDLRNPLNVASGYLELARETGSEEDFDKAMDAIQRMDQIIGELLTLSGKPEHFEKEDLSLEEVFKEAYSFVDCNPDYSLEGNIEFEGSRSGVVRMFQNLIENSVEHNRKDIEIEVGVLENGFYYTDSGQLSGNVDDILEYGYSESEDGSGIGLSVIQRVTEINNWKLNINETDNGSLKFEILCQE